MYSKKALCAIILIDMKKKCLVETYLYEQNDRYEIEALFENQGLHYEEKDQTKVIIMLDDNKIIRENQNFLMTLDFNKAKCDILDKELSYCTEILIQVNELIKNNELFYVDYQIEDSRYTYKISYLK